MSDDYRNGKYGRIKLGSTILAYADKWSLAVAADASQFPVFGGGGWKFGVVGSKGGTGSMEGAYDFDSPFEDDVTVGTEYTAELYLSTAAGGSASFITVTIQITNIEYTVDATTGDPERWTCSFQTNGTVGTPS